MGQSKRVLEMQQAISLIEQQITENSHTDASSVIKREKEVRLYKERASLKKDLARLQADLL